MDTTADHRPTGSAQTALALAAVLPVALGGFFVGFFVEWVWLLHAEDAAARSALESAIDLLALAAVAVLAVQFHRERKRRDFFLVCAMVLTVITTVVFDTLPAYKLGTDVHGTGALIVLSLVRGAALLAAALTSPGERLRQHSLPRLPLIVVVLGTAAASEAVELLVDPVRVEGARGGLDPVLVVSSLVALATVLAAALEFAKRPARLDPDRRLLAGASLLLVGTGLSRLAVPFPPSDWLMPADALRLAFFALMLWIGVRTYQRSEVELTHGAVIEERLRIARDLHDGLAQDLALIAAYADRLARTYGADHPVAIAAARALAGARGRIVDLEAASAPSIEDALREVGAELGQRLGVTVIVDVDGRDPTEEIDPEQRRELVRIAREGIANAARHGGARTVTVRLGSRRTGTLLTLSDDGCGLSRAHVASAGTGLGLRMMRSRARRLGARLRVGDRPEGGTEIEVIAINAVDPAADRHPSARSG